MHWCLLNVNRKGKHKERNRKKEETEQAAEPHQLDMEQESSNLVEDDQPDEEESVYISDQEDEKRELCIVSEIFEKQWSLSVVYSVVILISLTSCIAVYCANDDIPTVLCQMNCIWVRDVNAVSWLEWNVFVSL